MKEYEFNFDRNVMAYCVLLDFIIHQATLILEPSKTI